MLPLKKIEKTISHWDWNPASWWPAAWKGNHADGEVPNGRHEEPEPRRLKVGLALSSGSAKGLAHIGVIQVLEENGIEIDAIAGSSMGAYVGACWAAGYNGQELEELAADIKTSRDRLRLLDPVFPPRRGFIGGRKVRDRLEQTLHHKDFADLDRKLFVIATDMSTYDAKVFSEGPVARAVHASLAIPGVFAPVMIDDGLYVDGGVADPLPVRALLEAGMDRIIAVSVIPTVEELRASCLTAPDLPPPNLFQKAGTWLNLHLNYFAPGNILDVLRNSVLGAQIRVADYNGSLADVYIRPIVCADLWHDYHNYRSYIEAGRKRTEAHLDALLSLRDEPVPALARPSVHPILTKRNP